MRIRIGTRRSPLALWQAHHIAARLKANEPGLEVELVEIVTKGDKILDAPLANVGGKGLFVKEIEEQLLSGGVDLAVHSLKDMPALLPEGLTLAAVPEREDPRDAFVSARHVRLEDLPPGAKIGTSSLRRACQLKAWRRDLEIVSIRGNVQTRLRRIDESLDGGVLAAAGLKRLELTDRIRVVIDPQRLLPAVGQGALAIETREDDAEIRRRVGALEDAATRLAVTCERAFLARLGGSCQVPIAAYAQVVGAQPGAARGAPIPVHFCGRVGHPDGSRMVETTAQAQLTATTDAEALGIRAAEELLARGAGEILDSVLAPAGIPES